MTCPQCGPVAKPGNPQAPQPNQLSPETRHALIAGPLTRALCTARYEAARRYRSQVREPAWAFCLWLVLEPAELVHIKRVQLTLPPSATWLDAFDLLHRHGV